MVWTPPAAGGARHADGGPRGYLPWPAETALAAVVLVEMKHFIEAAMEAGRGIDAWVDERCHLRLPASVHRGSIHRRPEVREVVDLEHAEEIIAAQVD
jgi:hypothetical protein